MKRPRTWTLETERFATTPAEIRRLLAWLLERRVAVVVPEATSDYWRHLYYTLQPHLNLMLVNPAHLKGIRGRKSDPSDAAFLARAGASGIVMGSFRAGDPRTAGPDPPPHAADHGTRAGGPAAGEGTRGASTIDGFQGTMRWVTPQHTAANELWALRP
ncbi:transposase [Streptomyces xiangluensis]|uniref:Transposase n=1 Tax=Streptomyces xiangluensis TaxID=2665720 RepID=A0ABV8YU73_9ACTN